jgi:glycosyltransferase involved in cell wall biosynthesis
VSVNTTNAPSSLPKISCLTVTLNRLVLLKEAIRCFRDQTYPHKELVIVTNGTARYKQAIRRYIDTLDTPAIRCVALPEDDYTLGKLRNIAVEAAGGDLICQWDDDDLYHPERLRIQFEHLEQNDARACLMTDYLEFFRQEREMFWVNWTNRTQNPRHHLLPGTLLMYRDDRFRYPETGPSAVRGEDDDLIDQMYPVIKVSALREAGYLYVYTYHGKNTFPKDHHARLAIQSSSSLEFIRQRHPTLVQALEYYRLPMPYVVRTAEEIAFVYNR